MQAPIDNRDVPPRIRPGRTRVDSLAGGKYRTASLGTPHDSKRLWRESIVSARPTRPY